MKILSDAIKKNIAETLVQALGDPAFKVEDIYDQLVEPPSDNMGEIAFGCFRIAGALKKAPPQVSQDLQNRIAANDLIEKTQAAGPYLNFYLKNNFVGKNVFDPILANKYFQHKLTGHLPRTMIEYSQPNTHKELHVGHMRNACLGDAVIKLLKYVGGDVISSTFPGDVGTHVAKCLWYLKFHNTEKVPTTGKGEWLGQMYSKGHLKLEDEKGTPAEDKNREQLTLILKQLEAKSGEFYDLWKETREWSIELMLSVYKWCDIHFDYWYWESDVDAPSVEYVKDLYRQGRLIESQGAIGLDLEKDKLGFCMLLKSDGTGLYASKDLLLAKKKFEDHHIEKSIYVVDMRQALHFKQVFKSLEILGFEQAKNCLHLQYNFVELPDGAMSSRKGNIIPITRLTQNMENTVKANYLNRYANEWSSEEINATAKTIAQGAIKYGMLRMDVNKKIVFDMNEWLKLDGESGPFIQYSYARINSLCKKLGYNATTKVDWNLAATGPEKKLIKHLIYFNTAAMASALQYRPSILCTYLYELAQRFNFFYHECPVGNAETPALKQTRLALSHVTALTLKQGLHLLGIPVPERM